MVLAALLSGCRPHDTPPVVPVAPPVPMSVPVAVTPLAECPRDPSYADWPAGRRLRLEVEGDVEVGSALTLSVTDAVPGDRVVFHAGGACALDCPPDRDGACFQPADAAPLGEAVADSEGAATLDVVLATLPAGGVALQATAPDGRYLSQVWVDGLGAGIVPAAPMTVRRASSAELSWAVPAGRSVTLGVELTAEVAGWVEGATGSVRHPVTFPYVTAEATGFYLSMIPEYGTSGGIDLDIDTVPLPAPVPWFPDADGDGLGDPNGAPVASDLPVAGASADPRDCADADPAVHPGAAEVCGDGLDQDCDGVDRPCTARTGDPGGSGSRLVGSQWSASGIGVAAGDFDGDGDSEIAATGSPGWILPADRADHGPEAGVALLLPGQGAVAGDFDGDGVDDLALVDDGVVLVAGPIEVGPGAEPVTRGVRVVARQPWDAFPAVSAGDATGDGADDLVVGHTNGAALYDGAAHVPIAAVAPDDRFGYPVALADADGDGLADLWTGSGCVHLSPVPPAGAQPDSCVVGSASLGSTGLAVGDLDGDGGTDAAMGDFSGAHVVLGPWRGDRALDAARHALVPAATDRGSLAVARGADGPLLVYRTDTGPAEAWIGDVSRGGTVDRAGGAAIGLEGVGAVTADLDGDGLDEVVLPDLEATTGPAFETGAVWVLWGAEP